jgi:hypothetical protein
MNAVCRIAEDDWNALRASLFTPDHCENAGVLFCGVSTDRSQATLLVREFFPVPADQYRIRRRDQPVTGATCACSTSCRRFFPLSHPQAW